MSFHDVYGKMTDYGKTMPYLTTNETIIITSRHSNRGDIIQHDDEVSLQWSRYWDKKTWYMKCYCDSYCYLANKKEWFRILKKSSSGRTIAYTSDVHFEKSCPEEDIEKLKISASFKPWLYVETEYDGKCETWKVKLVKHYNQ